ncbi:glycoprotein-N-acetylgalactosamine 3-beta-galactosyltransferase 1-like [Rhipicephalus microplus]|uniref:glycoprotein-N-acetylgalactosamine 3-beta-galactosyltransferase 1-like n=1 Tax=Rhipicephalus microplus TaxID=6941 RepID=UPI003F6CACA8
MLPKNVCARSLDVPPLALGLVVGIALGLMWQEAPNERHQKNAIAVPSVPKTATLDNGDTALLRRHLSVMKSNGALVTALKNQHVIEVLQKDLAAEKLQLKVAIFCVIHTFYVNYTNLDLIVNASWGRHCDHLLFVSNELDTTRTRHTMYVEEGNPMRACLAVLRYLWEFNNDAVNVNWFLWASVQSFVIVENLRHMVEDLDSSKPSYLGALWHGARTPRPSVHSTFVINRAALDRIALTNCSSFRTIQRCVNRAGVKVIESRDERGCERFSNRQLKAEWLPFRNAFTPSMPQPCLSLTFVSVHASPSEVLLFEYLTRVLTAYGERARVNVTDTWLRWNASTMPEWTDTELHRIQLAAKRLSPHSATKQK